MKNWNEKTAFNQTNEVYIGSWFGYDVWEYLSCNRKNLLAVYGNEPGDYCTWVGNSSWFEPNAKIGNENGSIPLEQHLTECDYMKAFLMAYAAIHNRKY